MGNIKLVLGKNLDLLNPADQKTKTKTTTEPHTLSCNTILDIGNKINISYGHLIHFSIWYRIHV